MMTPKHFVTRFAYGFFLLFALAGIFNRIVDPAWYYRDTVIKGFNAVKPEFLSFEQRVKPALLVRDQPEALILGSSYAEIGFDPTNPFFTDRGRMKGMNFAFARAPWEKVQCHFEYAVTHSKIKRALVGFHPGDLPMADCEKDSEFIGDIDTIDLLFTYSALDFSIKTILKQKESDITHTPEGMYFYYRGVNPASYFRQGLEARSAGCGNSKRYPEKLQNLNLSGLRRMIQSAQAHNVELVLFAYPEHAYLLEMDYLCGDMEEKWKVMQQIGSFIDSESAGKIPAWQFYGYNAVTAEPVRNSMWYWQDSRHFNYEVGNMFLEDIFAKSRSPENNPVFARSLNTSYADFLNERDEYLRFHPQFTTNMRWVNPKFSILPRN